MADSIGHLSLIVSAQSFLDEDLSKESAKIKRFASNAKRDMSGGGLFGGLGGGGFLGGLTGALAGNFLPPGLSLVFNTLTQLPEMWDKATASLEKFTHILDSPDKAKRLEKEAEAEKTLNEQRERIAEARARGESVRDAFNKSSRLERESIGLTGAELKVLEARFNGVAISKKALDFARETEMMQRFAAQIKASADAINAFEMEQRNIIENAGLSDIERKLRDLSQGGIPGNIDFLRKQAEQAERLTNALSLIDKNPIDVLKSQLGGLEELLNRGRISADQFNAASDKAKEAFFQQQDALNKNKPSPALVRGTAAEISFRNQQTNRDNQEKLLQQQLDKDKEQLDEAKKQTGILEDIKKGAEDARAVVILGL